MNKIYKVVWSKAKHCYVVTSELAKRQTKGCGARSLRMATVSMGVAASLLCAGAVLPIFGESVAEAGASNNTVTVSADWSGRVIGGLGGYAPKPTDKFGGASTTATDPVYKNKVIIESGTITKNGDSGGVYGGYGRTGEVSYNSITINGGTIDTYVYNVFGGVSFDDSESIHHNTVTINDGVVNASQYIRGGYSWASAVVNENKVIITGGRISSLASVVGGESYKGIAKDNEVTISGVQGGNYVYGGRTYNGKVTNNKVYVSGSETRVGSAVGGGSQHYNDNTLIENNKVTIENGTVYSAYGGMCASGAQVNDNTVTINGGTVSDYVYGGITGYGKSASNNKVFINNGKVGNTEYGSVYGGHAHGATTSVTKNVVTIANGTVDTKVYGGYNRENVVGGESADDGNKVFINGGTVINAYGGASESGSAKNNAVIIDGGTVKASTSDTEGTVYGGYVENMYDNAGAVTDNTVTIKSGVVGNNYSAIYGGRSYGIKYNDSETSHKSGEVTGNKVSVEGGTVKGNVYGGYSDSDYNLSGDVTGNSVTITGGKVTGYSNQSIYGGYTWGKDESGENASGKAEDNTVTVSGGELTTADLYGGNSNGGDAIHNIVKIENTFAGTVNNVIGGEGQLTATKNEVTINGGSAKGNVIGALSYAGTAGGDSAAAGNKATVDSAVVEGNLIGGWGYQGAANYNTVTVKGSTSKIGDASNDNVAPVIGGLSGYFGATVSSDTPASGDAKNNTVVIENGNIDGSVYGGASITHTSKTSGDVTGNKVQINGGKVLSSVYGGYNHSGSADKTASNNEVTMDGGSADIVYGGWSLLGKAGQNTITLNSGAEAGKVYGGWGGATAEKNKVIIDGGTVRGDVFGGGGAIWYNSTATGVETATGNTVTVKDGTVKNVTGGSGIDSAENNTVIIEKTGKVSNTIVGGDSATGNIKNNTVTIKGGTIGNLVYAAQYVQGSEGTITDNVINLTGNVTLGTYVHLRGYECRSSYEVPNHSGNDLHVGGIKGGATGVWQGRNSEGTVTNTVVSVAKFDTIVYHSVKWDENVAALAATTVENIGAIDINDLTFDSASATGTMALLKATGDGADLSTIKLNYSGGSGVAITTGGVVIGGGTPSTETTGVNGVKLTSISSDKVLLASDKKAINYAKGATTVSGITFGTFDKAEAARSLTGVAFAGTNTIDAADLQFKATSDALKKNDSITLLTTSATGMATAVANGTGKRIAINNYKDAQGIVFGATAKGTVTSTGSAVNYSVGSVDVNTINLAGWTGTTSAVTDGWITAAANVTTSGISVSGMNPGDKKAILTAASGSDFSNVTLDAGAWQEGGAITDTAVNGVTIAGTTTGGGVKVSDDKSQLIYQQDKKNVTGITLGAFDASQAARSFGSGDDLTAATVNAGGFSISNLDATKASVVVVDATNAIKDASGATLKEFAKQNAGDAIPFEDKIARTVLTFSGTHQDTLEQNDAKTQIIYKVGDKNVTGVKFDGEVAWSDSPYYEADAVYKFAATDVDAAGLTVTGSSTAVLKKGDAMTLLSAEGMKANITAAPADAGGVDLSYTEKGISFTGKTRGEVKAADNAVKYEVTGVGVNSVDIGEVAWQKGAALVDNSDASYDFTGVKEIGTKNFAVTYADGVLQTVAKDDSMTLLAANETLNAIIAEEKSKFEKTYTATPVDGVTVNAKLTSNVTNDSGNVKVTAASNQATELKFEKVEWTGDTPLLDHGTTLQNVSFDGATVDTSNIDFYKEMYIEADQTTTLVDGFDGSPKEIKYGTYLVGTAYEGEGTASVENGKLVYRTTTSAGLSEQTHKTVMAMAAGTALLAGGNEHIGKALESLGDVANQDSDGTSVGVSIGGAGNRYETGSHVNVNSWNATVAIGAKRDLKQGALEYGVFGEYGKGSYKLYNDDGGKGDGDAHYAGGGLMAKWTSKHDVYTEASFRLGRMSDSADNILEGGGNKYGYDVHANYYGAHIGVGKIFRYKGGKSLDVYGKYFYTKRDGVEYDAKQHYNLDSVASSILRIGARYGSTDKKWNWYGGLAYEYEFDGEAKGTVNGTAIKAASIKGSSVRGELGMRMSATKDNPWQADISIYGYGGKHRGFGGNVSVAYTF